VRKLRYLDPKNHVLGETWVEDGHAAGSGIGMYDDELTVIEPNTLVVLTPADGERWLQGLWHMARTPYVRAIFVDA